MKKKTATVATSFLVMALSVGLVAPATAATPAPPPKVTAAIGDSMSRGVAADGTRALQPENSWTQGNGTKVNSHFKRLSSAYGTSIISKNFAVSGTKAASLQGQAQKASAAKANYVTVLSGANDICGASSVATLPSAATYKTNVRNALKALNAGSVKPQILVGSVPSLMKLYNVGKTHSEAVNVWNSGKVCGIMLSAPLDTSATANARRAAVETRVQDFNKALKEVCAEYSNCYFDDNAIYNIGFTYEDISTLDHFHASVSGQNKIASATWDKVVAKKMFTARATAPVAPKPTQAPVKVAPTVSILSPSTPTVAGVVTLKVKAVSDSAIKTVVVNTAASGNIALVKKSDGFWYANVDTKKFSNGKVSVTAKATDSENDVTTTKPASFTVKN